MWSYHVVRKENELLFAVRATSYIKKWWHVVEFILWKTDLDSHMLRRIVGTCGLHMRWIKDTQGQWVQLCSLTKLYADAFCEACPLDCFWFFININCRLNALYRVREMLIVLWCDVSWARPKEITFSKSVKRTEDWLIGILRWSLTSFQFQMRSLHLVFLLAIKCTLVLQSFTKEGHSVVLAHQSI